MNEAGLFTSTKTFENFPCAHRQYRHDGNCHLIHGYSRSFVFTFGANQLTKEGFLVDYGALKELKRHLDFMYDHTLVLDPNDNELAVFLGLQSRGVCMLRFHPMGPGMEGTAAYMGEWAHNMLRSDSKARAWVISCEARENNKNSSIWHNPVLGMEDGEDYRLNEGWVVTTGEYT